MRLYARKMNLINIIRLRNPWLLFHSDILCVLPKSTILVHDGLGVVIGKNVKIGENCKIYQGVTIGSNPRGEGTVIIGNNVKIFPYCVITGNIVISDNSIIRAYSFIDKDVRK